MAVPVQPEYAETIQILLRFYSVETLEQLVVEQANHIEKLQAKLITPKLPAFTRVWEG